MSVTVYLMFALAVALLGLVVWALRGPRKQEKHGGRPDLPQEAGVRHVSFLPQIQQALGQEDDEFLREKGPKRLRRRVRQERQRVALAYLSALRKDFENLLRVARIIAVLSPEVVAVQELERLRLTVKFAWRYELIRVKLWTGMATLPQLDGLSHLVSGLSVRMEAAMKELGERAAIAAELASALERRGLDAT